MRRHSTHRYGDRTLKKMVIVRLTNALQCLETKMRYSEGHSCAFKHWFFANSYIETDSNRGASKCP